MFLVTPPPFQKHIVAPMYKVKQPASVFCIYAEEIESRLYNKVAYSNCALIYGKCRLFSIDR